MTDKEKLRYQVFYNGEWNDETEDMYLRMVNNNKHGRVLNSKGVVVESTMDVDESVTEPTVNDISKRIEAEAREYCKGSPQFIFEYRGFIAGAKWWNDAVIDELIKRLNLHPVGLTAEQYAAMTKKELESLKINL